MGQDGVRASRPRTLTLAERVEEDGRLLGSDRAAISVSINAAPGLSIGVGQRPPIPSADRASAAGFPVQRRSSGGSSVLLGAGDICWSLVLPLADPRVGRDFVQAFGRLGASLPPLFAEVGASAAWKPSPGLSEELCVLGSRGEVLEVEGRIVGGAAQHRTGRALLHHGFLSRRVAPARLGELFLGLPREARDRLAGWEDLGLPGGPELWAARLERRLVADWL